MSSDPHDELAQFRARRDRERRPHPASPPDTSSLSIEQQEAIARAREAWNLRRQGRNEPDGADSTD
jgi:hypothetical protein